MKFKRFIGICLPVLLLTFPFITSLTKVSAYNDSDYLEVDLAYLSTHMQDFYGEKIRTTGIVCFMISYYMYEDFWLSGAIPVVVRFTGLPIPPENSSVEIFGIIEYCNFEGGFFYFNAQELEIIMLPEFPLVLIVPLFMAATLLAVLIYRKIIKF